jgi:hypothetical protein
MPSVQCGKGTSFTFKATACAPGCEGTAVPSHPGAQTVDLEVKQVPFATLHTRPPDDRLQMGPKHVQAWCRNKAKK